MACHACGTCSYSDASVADVEYSVVVSGDVPCATSAYQSHSNLPYASPGTWEATTSAGVVRAVAGCAGGGTWRFETPAPPPPPRQPLGPVDCYSVPSGSIVSTLRNDCGGFHAVKLDSYFGGGTVATTLKITVRNNAECQA